MGLGELRRELDDIASDLLQPGGEGRKLPGSGQVLGENGVEHCQQEQGVGAGADEMVLAGQLRGLGAARIDHHQFSAAVLQRLDAFFDIRHGPDAAVGGDWVRSQHEEVVGAVDVGNGEQGLVAEQPQGYQVVGQLVDTGGGEAVVGAQVAEQLSLVGHHAVVVHGGVAQVDAQRIDAVAPGDFHQAPGGGIQRFLPAYLFPGRLAGIILDPFQRPAQAVRVLVYVLQGHGLGADVAAAQRVVLVALDRGDLIAFGLDDQPADRLAQVAGPVVPLAAHARCSRVISPRPEISISRLSRSFCRRLSDTSYSASRVW